MIDLATEYWNYWNSAVALNPERTKFLQAFPQGTVPAGQIFPFMTYQVNDYGMFQQGLNELYIWTRSGNNTELWTYYAELKKAIPHSGIILTLPDNAGSVAIYRGNPFYQDYIQEDTAIKAGRILVQINSYLL